ncbi:hypothetical protein [Novosphingobium lindaniclasticum]|uniref:hypothetical protein n=1 Tax=Novosphingobium lindaniclasticum TaxID=1329895 RepID=UPI00240A2A14|nr:hypothetical protein [Novosphingobium lindaniclasticum]
MIDVKGFDDLQSPGETIDEFLILALLCHNFHLVDIGRELPADIMRCGIAHYMHDPHAKGNKGSLAVQEWAALCWRPS